jgi:hypothetical protein
MFYPFTGRAMLDQQTNRFGCHSQVIRTSRVVRPHHEQCCSSFMPVKASSPSDSQFATRIQGLDGQSSSPGRLSPPRSGNRTATGRNQIQHHETHRIDFDYQSGSRPTTRELAADLQECARRIAIGVTEGYVFHADQVVGYWRSRRIVPSHALN